MRLLLLSIICFLTSCNNTDKHDTIKKASIESCFDVDNNSFHYIKRNCHSFSDDSIILNLEIRLSLINSWYCEKQYFLKYNGSSWQGNIAFHTVNGETTIKEIMPKIGWKSFEDSLVSIDINSIIFNDSEKKYFENMQTVCDGYDLELEIITQNQYKIYTYSNPDKMLSFSKAFKSSSLKKFERFYNLIECNIEPFFK